MTGTLDVPRVGAPANARTLVVDLAYGVTTIGGATGPDLTALMNAIDADVIVAGGVSASAHARWRDALAAITGGLRAPVVVGYPSTWGSVRAGVLMRAAAALNPAPTLLPRAVLIARSHADVTVTRCAVVETSHLPRQLDAPRRSGPHRTGRRWDVQRMRRGSNGWQIESCGVLAPSGDVNADATAVEELIDDGVEAVYVDGVDGAEVVRAIDVISDHAVAGRVVAVDRALLARRGAEPLGLLPLDFTYLDAASGVPTAQSSMWHGSRRRLLMAAASIAVIVVAAVTIVGISLRSADTPPGDRPVTQGRTTLVIPSHWHRNEQTVTRSTAGSGSLGQSRTVFVAPDDGSRILLIQSPVRSGSTSASVAVSLRNRIVQRGDDVVSEFSASTRFAGRDVISYREAPASGAPIRWYVLVEHDLQVSVGCQGGTGGDSVDGACERAVSSARIAP